MFYRLALCLTVLASLVLGACSETQRVSPDECGNHIVEDGEDCDGGSGCSAACRFLCSTDKPDICPSGWGCDESAGVCRTGSGRFNPISLGTQLFPSVRVADFDGDGRDDLLAFTAGQGEVSSVYYFDPGTAVERTVTLPAANGAATANMAGDASPDILLTSERVTLAFRSTPSRSFSPLIGALRELPTGAKLLAADLDCDGRRDILLMGGDSDTTLSYIKSKGRLDPLLGKLAIGASDLRLLEEGPEDLRNTVPHELTATGTFSYAGLQCEVLALPAPGLPAVDLYASRDGGASIQRVSRVTYPSDAEPSRWLFAELDGDGSQDLVITTPFGDQWVSYGRGDGTFEPTVSVLDSYASGEILAAGELDNHAGTDFYTAPSDFLRDYQARALDLTGDFRTDVAAVGAQHRIDLHRAHETGLTSRLSVPLRGVPHIEDVGDFDGDGVWDLLLSEGSAEGEPRKTASVLFAPVTSATASAVELASFERIEQMAAGYFHGDLNADASVDIGVLFRQKGKDDKEGPLQLGLMEGGADRLLRSRLRTREADDKDPDDPESPGDDFFGTPVMGHFHSKDELELAFVSVDPGGTGVGTIVDLLTVGVDGISYVRRVKFPELSFFSLSSLNGGVVALDLDRDELDEIYLTTPTDVVRLVGDGKDFSATSIMQNDVLSSIAAQDTDGDGIRDLTVLSERGLTVLRAAKGGSSSSLISLSKLDCEVVEYEYAFVQADSDPELELVASCRDQFGEISIQPPIEDGGGELTAQLSLHDVNLADGSLSELWSQRSIITGALVPGDFNGDGVQDLAAGSWQEVVVMFGIPLGTP